MPSSSPRRRRSTVRSRTPPSNAACRCSSRSRWRRRTPRRSRSSRAGRAAGVPVQVGHVERYNPAVLRSASCSRDGWLTTLYSIVSRRAGPFPARIRDVGVTIDLATHDADMLSWIAGERPTRVYAELAQRKHAAHEDLLFGLLHFPSGTSGMLDVNWLTPAKRRQLSVVGEEGMFELDYLTQRLTFTRSDLAGRRFIAGYAPTFAGDVVDIEVETHEPLQAAARRVRQDASGRVPRRMSTARTGRGPCAIATALLEAASTVPSGEPRRRGSRGRDRRPTAVGRRLALGGSIRLPPNPCTHAPATRVAPWTGEAGTAGTVAVVGAGKMGLPLAAQFASHGWDVIAVDVNPDVVDAINAGRSHVDDEPGLGERSWRRSTRPGGCARRSTGRRRRARRTSWC